MRLELRNDSLLNQFGYVSQVADRTVVFLVVRVKRWFLDERDYRRLLQTQWHDTASDGLVHDASDDGQDTVNTILQEFGRYRIQLTTF